MKGVDRIPMLLRTFIYGRNVNKNFGLVTQAIWYEAVYVVSVGSSPRSLN